jgi:hypothetical protein
MAALLTTLSILTCLVSGWMTIMFFVLRHPHYLERAALGGVIFLGAAAVAAGGWRGPAALRATLGAWALALFALGVWAVFGNGGDDGWVLIAGLLFIAEGAATGKLTVNSLRSTVNS